MTKNKIEGVITPIITPFTSDGDINEKAFCELIEFLGGYVQGFFPCAGYGSGPLMNIEQREKVAEILVDQTDGELPVIVHVGAADTKTAVMLAKHAESIGAYAVAAGMPYYYGHHDAELENYYSEIMGSVNIPVYIYDNAKSARNTISPNLLTKLIDIGLAGIESGDIGRFCAYLRKVTKPGFDFIILTEALAFPAMLMGVKSIVAGLSNVFPEIVVQLYQTCVKRDYNAAVELQKRVLELRDVMYFKQKRFSTIYAMLGMRGINAGSPRSPFEPLSEEEYKQVENSLYSLGVL